MFQVLTVPFHRYWCPERKDDIPRVRSSKVNPNDQTITQWCWFSNGTRYSLGRRRWCIIGEVIPTFFIPSTGWSDGEIEIHDCNVLGVDRLAKAMDDLIKGSFDSSAQTIFEWVVSPARPLNFQTWDKIQVSSWYNLEYCPLPRWSSQPLSVLGWDIARGTESTSCKASNHPD